MAIHFNTELSSVGYKLFLWIIIVSEGSLTLNIKKDAQLVLNELYKFEQKIAYSDGVVIPLIESTRSDSTYVSAQHPVNSRTMDANEHTNIAGCPFRICQYAADV